MKRTASQASRLSRRLVVGGLGASALACTSSLVGDDAGVDAGWVETDGGRTDAGAPDAGGVADAGASDAGSNVAPIDGGTRVISGVNFGTSSPVSRLWLGGAGGYIESQSNDASFRSHSPASELLFDIGDWRISTAQPRGRRSHALLWNASDSRNPNPYNGTVLYRPNRPALGSAYFHQLFFWTHDSQPLQWKILRYVAVGPDESSCSGYTDDCQPNFYVSNLINSGIIALNGTGYQGKYGHGAEFFGDVTAPNTSSGVPGVPGRWIRFESEFRDSTTLDSADGFASWKFTDTVTGQVIGQMTITNFRVYPGSGSRIRYLVMQNYTDVQGQAGNPAGGDSHIWMQDTFIQVGSRARVMLGNAARYGDCTQFELCEETQRSDESLSAVINQGAFASLENLYWYVWNADGVLVSTDGVRLS